MKSSERRKRTTNKTTNSTSTNNNEKPLLKRLFGKKKRAESSNQNQPKKGLFNAIADIFDDDNKVEKVKGKRDKNAKYVRRVRKVPVNINYTFKQVEGANGKFISIIPYKNKLLGVSTSGIYELTKQGAEVIIPENVQSFMVNSQDQLVVSTSSLELKLYQLDGDVWIEQSSTPMNDIIVSIQEDDLGNMWMAGSGSIYKTTSTDTTFSIDEKLELNNIFLDEVNILNKNDTLYFINSQGYFYL